MKYLLLLILLCFSCSSKHEEDINDKFSNDIKQINSEINIIESLYDSSLNKLSRGVKWNEVKAIYSDSIKILFLSLNDHISQLNQKASDNDLDSAQYESLIRQIRLNKAKIKLIELKDRGFEFNLN